MLAEPCIKKKQGAPNKVIKINVILYLHSSDSIFAVYTSLLLSHTNCFLFITQPQELEDSKDDIN